MKSPQLGLRVASALAALIGLAHLLRLVVTAEMNVGSYHVGLWPSVAAVLVSAALCAWFWRLASLAGKLPSSP